MFDLPPVKEYDLYIRSFGRSDTRQAYVQTRDDDIDRDIQTEDVETLVKWTQHPPDNEIAVGGDDFLNRYLVIVNTVSFSFLCLNFTL